MESQPHRQGSTVSRRLSILDSAQPHNFIKPAKKINEGHDLPWFFTSRAYGDIGLFVMQLNTSMCPRKTSYSSGQTQTWELDSPVALSEPVRRLQELLQRIDAIIEEAPPDAGPRRFGNVSFRKWYEILESRVQDLLNTHLPETVLHFGGKSADGVTVLDELTPYLLGGFGSAQRLDYGTGHELSFLAFLGCVWKLGGFTGVPSQDGSLERSLVIGVVEPYVLLFSSFVILSFLTV
jgi:serine/threonine-protein phosphatase 2A activator